MTAAWATAALMLVGAVLSLLAAAGVLRLPDVLVRMQASAKASTLGLGCVLAGAALQMTDMSSVIRLAAIGAFVMLTAPLTGHIVARAATLRRTPLWEGTVVNDLSRRDVVEAPTERGADRGATPAP